MVSSRRHHWSGIYLAAYLALGLLLPIAASSAPIYTEKTIDISIEIVLPDPLVDGDLSIDVRPDETLVLVAYSPARGGIVAAGNAGGSWSTSLIPGTTNSGAHSAYTLDATGQGNLAYYDESLSALIYTGWVQVPWLFDVSVVDPSPFTGEISLAVGKADTLLLAFYDSIFGDLKLGREGGSGWAIENLATAGDVGSFLDMDLDGSFRPGFAFFDATETALRYLGPVVPPWIVEIEVLDPDPSAGPMVMSVGPDGLHVAYHSGIWGSIFHLEQADSTWTKETVIPTGEAGPHLGFVWDGPGMVSIVTYGSTTTSLSYSGWLTSPWISDIVVVDPSPGGGLSPRLRTTPFGGLALAYLDGYLGVLKYATFDQTGWSVAPVPEASGWSSTCDLTLDDEGRPSAAGYNDGDSSLEYVGWVPGGWGITIEILDPYVAPDTGFSLVANGLDLHLAQVTGPARQLRYGYLPEGGTWSFQAIHPTTSPVAHPTMTIGPAGNRNVAHYDGSQSALGYTGWLTPPWTFDSEIVAAHGTEPRLRIAADGTLALGYYHPLTADLRIARLDGALWQDEAVDTAGNVGQFLDMAPGTTGSFGFSYYDADLQALKYAGQNLSSWLIDIEVLDPQPGSGKFPSLALKGDRIHIAHYNELTGELRYLTDAGGDWTSTTLSTGFGAGSYASLAATDTSRISVASYHAGQTALDYRGWLVNPWAFDITVVDSRAVSDPVLVTTSSHSLAIGYYVEPTADLVLARQAPTGWSTETVVSTDDMGRYCDLARTPDDGLAFSFYDATATALMYAGSDLGAMVIAIEVIDPTLGSGFGLDLAVKDTEIHLVAGNASNGALTYYSDLGSGWQSTALADAGDCQSHCALAIDATGHINVASHRSGDSALYYTGWLETPWVFTSEVIDSSPSAGAYCNLVALPGDSLAVAYHNTDSGTLLYGTYSGTTWTVTPLNLEGNSGPNCDLTVDGLGRPAISYFDATQTALGYVGWLEPSFLFSYFLTDADPGTEGPFSLKVDLQNIHLSYYNPTNQQLRYRGFVAGSLVRKDFNYPGDEGHDASLAVGPEGLISIACYDATESALLYLGWLTNPWTFDISTITPQLGEFPVIGLDGQELPLVAYYEPQQSDLVLASYDGTAWGSVILDATGDVGMFCDMSRSGEEGFGISYFDAVATALKYVGPDPGGVSNMPGETPRLTALHGASPNPFNPMTTIRYSMSREQHVALRVYDMRGRLVAAVFDGIRGPGVHDVVWNGRDERGMEVPAGIYLVRMVSEDGSWVVKTALVR